MIQYYPIKLLKMVTGETVISGIGDAKESTYVLERPMAVLVSPVRARGHGHADGRAQEGVQVILKDWIDFSGDNYIMVPKSSVVCITTPYKELVGDYQMAKINADIDADMGSAPDVLSDDYKDDINDGDDEPNDPEFPGWGGDPRLDE